MAEKIVLSDKEKEIIGMLDDSLYTVEYIEEWVNRNDNVFVNAPSALSAMGAKGFYQAVKRMAKKRWYKYGNNVVGKPI